MRETFLFIFALGIFHMTPYQSSPNHELGKSDSISFIKIMKQRPIDDQGPSEDRNRNRDRNDDKKEREKEPKNQREMKDA